MKSFVVGQSQNESLSINIDTLLRTRMLVQANSGGGKSYLLRRILEQSHGKVQQIVIDLEGEFSTLREQYDYILLGKGGEVMPTVRYAGEYAEKILELGLSAIIDLYELKHGERIRFVKIFLEAMINVRKELWHPCLVVIDEAHQFAPEKGESEALSAVIDICTRGRKRSFCAVLATQRISKLHKDAAAECNNKLIGRAGLDIDMKRAAEELGFTSKEDMLSLRTLAPGEFYAFGPAITPIIMKVKVGKVQTTHPDIGSKSVLMPPPPREKVKHVLNQLASLPQEAEEKIVSLTEAQKKIRELERQLRQQPKPVQKVDESVIAKRVQDAVNKTEARYVKTMKHAKEFIESEASEIRRRLERINKSLDLPLLESQFEYKPVKQETKTVFIHPTRTVTNQVKTPTKKTEHIGGNLTNPEQRILDAIAWLESIGIDTPEQPAVSFLAGYRYGGGAYNNPRGALRVRGFVEYVGDRIRLTDEGKAIANYPDKTLTAEQLHDKVMSRLPGPEQRLLKPLLECYPDSLTNEELAEASGYTVNSGGYNNPRGRLRTLGLIEYLGGGRVKAKSLLFLEQK